MCTRVLLSDPRLSAPRYAVPLHAAPHRAGPGASAPRSVGAWRRRAVPRRSAPRSFDSAPSRAVPCVVPPCHAAPCRGPPHKAMLRCVASNTSAAPAACLDSLLHALALCALRHGCTFEICPRPGASYRFHGGREFPSAVKAWRNGACACGRRSSERACYPARDPPHGPESTIAQQLQSYVETYREFFMKFTTYEHTRHKAPPNAQKRMHRT